MHFSQNLYSFTSKRKMLFDFLLQGNTYKIYAFMINTGFRNMLKIEILDGNNTHTAEDAQFSFLSLENRLPL